jgi:hypothetical protein
MKTLSILAVISAGVFFINGCTTTRSVAAKPLKPVYAQGTGLSHYDLATVVPFEVTDTKAVSGHVGENLANDIAHRLESDFGPLFQNVRVGQPLGVANELVVSGQITDYRPGSRAARLLGPGIGKADLKGNVILKDGASGQPVLIAPISKLWAWGHEIGAAKGMDNMLEETAASAANLVARTRGWHPERQASVAP